MKYLSLFLLFSGILFNLILYYPETKITLDPNDNVFQFALVNRTNTIWQQSHCPLSLSCLPNLVDHWVPNWAEGYALPFYYSHLPQIAIVATYNLLIHPLLSILGFQFSVFQYYTWIKYLLLCFFPLPIFIALRIIGINPIVAALSAFLGSHLSTDGLYGIDPPSYLWRGYGLTSQLYSTFFIPLAIAFTFKSLEEISNINYTLWAIIFTTLSIAGHLGIGMILLLTLPVFLFLDFKKSFIILRAKRLAFIVVISIFALSYWILPAMLQNKYHLISFWDPIWKFSSWGMLEVVRQFFSGEIFDWKRLPIITLLTTIGFFALILHKKYFPFALAFAFWMLLYFGRTTWGGLIDLIPGMKDFHQSRFIVGVHIASLFLIPAGLSFILELINSWILRGASFFEHAHRVLSPDGAVGVSLGGAQKKSSDLSKIPQDPQIIIFKATSLLLIILTLILTLRESIDYASLNNKWIGEANTAYNYQEKDFHNLINALAKLPPGRIYAGRPGNWGRDFRASSTQMYLAISVLGYPISQFLPESWSPNSDNEEMFDERIWQDYNLYNLRYLIAPASFTPPNFAKLLNTFGPYYLYEIPTSGYFDVVSSNILVNAQKTNFVNIVHVWQKSYSRYWNSYPLISLENKNPPANISRSITMTDLANYKLDNQEYNLFASFPFSYPEATVSGKIMDASHDKPSTKDIYSAKVTVPANCQNCFTLFKMTYHPNWQARLDGQPVAVYSTFPFYMSIPTPPGEHIVEFSYKPSGLKIALLLLEVCTLVIFLFKNKLKNLVSK